MEQLKDKDVLKGLNEKQLAGEKDAAEAEINSIIDEIGDAEAPDSKLSDIGTLEKYINDIETIVVDKREKSNTLSGYRERSAGRQKANGTPTHRPGQTPEGHNQKGATVGSLLTTGIKGYLESVTTEDGKVTSSRIESPSVAAKHLLKSLISGASNTSAGALVVNDRSPIITDRDPFAPLTLRDIITVGETTSDAVDIAVITGHTNNAAPVAEATDSAGTSGTPPESDIAAKVETTNVRDISHYVTVSKRAIADAGQIQTYANTFLMNGLGVKLESQMVGGDGTGENLLGIRNTPNIQTQAFSTDIFETTRKARTKCTNAQVVPNAILMCAEQWEVFDLAKDANGQFRFGGPSVLGNPRLWGTNVIENQAIPMGKAILADFRYAMLWDRMVAELTMSDAPNNYYLRKLVAIMGSLRAAFAVLYPRAFVEITLVGA